MPHNYEYDQSDQSDYGDDFNTSQSEDDHFDLSPSPFDDGNIEGKKSSVFSPLCIATTTCLHKYAIERMLGAENGSLPWPPLMLVIFEHLNNRYPRTELVTERNKAMLELLLKLPIQLLIKRGDEYLDLNNNDLLDFTNMSFVQSLEMLHDLVDAGIVQTQEIRVPNELFGRS